MLRIPDLELTALDEEQNASTTRSSPGLAVESKDLCGSG